VKKRTVWIGAASLAAALTLLPLWGDTTPGSAVTHPEWARMVLQGMDLLEGGGDSVTDTAAVAFSILSGRDSRSWGADSYVRGREVRVVREDETRVVRPTGPVGEAVYSMAVARAGDYRLRLRIAGPEPAEAEVAYIGDAEAIRSFRVPSAPLLGWVDAGVVHLEPGAYDTAVLLPEGATLEHVELAPPCLHPIEPHGGWQPTAITTTEDVAVTVLQAVDMEYELPPAAPPLEFRGSDLRLEDGSRAVDASAGDDGSFRGGPRGAQVLLVANVTEPGLYTLSVFGSASGGQRWTADGCRTQALCPSPDSVERWRVVLSGELGEGRHLLTAALGPGSSIDRIRLERKKDAPADYVATVARLGLDLGEESEVSRETAEEARRFIGRRRATQAAELCGDVLEPGTLISELTSGTGPGSGGDGGTGPGGGGGEGGEGGGGGEPVPPPVIPPLPPASGTVPVGFGG